MPAYRITVLPISAYRKRMICCVHLQYSDLTYLIPYGLSLKTIFFIKIKSITKQMKIIDRERCSVLPYISYVVIVSRKTFSYFSFTILVSLLFRALLQVRRAGSQRRVGLIELKKKKIRRYNSSTAIKLLFKVSTSHESKQSDSKMLEILQCAGEKQS